MVAPADAAGGHYCEDCHVAEIENDPNVPRGVRAYALDPEHAKALWAKEERGDDRGKVLNGLRGG
jgi:hypothetical protein